MARFQRMFISSLLAAVVTALQAPPGYAPLSDNKVCATNDANIIPKLPRVNAAGRTIKSDIGSYYIFDCEGDASARSCSVSTAFTSAIKGPSDISTIGTNPAVVGTPVEYGEGLLGYTVLNIVVAILLVLGNIIFVIFRYCCCCCRPSQCTCLRCGTPWPTQKNPTCGFTDLPDGTLGYPRWERILTILYMVVFIIIASCLVIVGNVKGNHGLTTSLPNMLSAGDGIEAMVMGALPPLENLVVSVASTAFAPALSSMNTTVQAAVDIPSTVAALRCMNSTLWNLPNVTLALALLNALQNSSSALDASCGQIQSQLNVLAAQKSTISGGVAQLSTDVASLYATFIPLNASLLSLSGNVSAAATLKSTLVPLSSSVSSDLAALPRTDAAPPGQFPSVSTFLASTGTDITDPTPGTVNRLIAGATNGQAAEITTLINRLSAIRSALAAMPNYTLTSIALQSIGSASASASTLVPNLQSSLASLQASVALLPSAATEQARILALNASVAGVNLSAIQVSVGAIQATIQSLPSFASLIAEVEKVRALPVVLPCLLTLTNQLATINATLFKLPDSVQSLAALFNSVNDTISTAVAQVNSTEASILSANASINALNTSSYTAQIASAQASLATQRAAFNFPGLNAEIGRMGTSVTSFNFSGVNASITALGAALTAVNQTALTQAEAALLAFQSSKETLVAQLTSAVAPLGSFTAPNIAGYIVLYSLGYCSGNTALYCSVDTNCSSVGAGTCTTAAAGTRRCSSGAQTTTCSSSTDCPVAGTFCLVDPPSITSGLLASLNAAQSSTVPPDMSTQVAIVNTVSTQSSAVDTSGASSSLSAASTAISGIDTTGTAALLASLGAALNAFDLSGTNATLTSARAQIKSIPFSTFVPQVSNLISTVDDLTSNKRPLVNQALQMAVMMQGLLSTELSAYLNVLSASSLLGILDASGPRAMIESITAGVLDRAVAYVLSSQSQFSFSLGNVTNTADQYLEYVDKAAAKGAYTDNSMHGSAYYFGMLAADQKMVLSSDPTAKYVFGDVNGNAYSDGRMCVTTECVTASVNLMNTGTVGQWHDAAPGFLPSFGSWGSSTPLTREGLFFIPWIAPICAILIAIFAVMAPTTCCRTCSPAWQKCPSGWAICCMMCQLPCMFLLVGLVFPLILAFGDTCASGYNIADNYLVSYGDPICTNMLQGQYGGLESCTYSFNETLVSTSVSVTANVPVHPAFRALFDGCPAPDPIGATINNVASQFSAVPYQIVSHEINDPSSIFGDSGTSLRPAVANILITATNTTTAALLTAVAQEAAGPFGCSSISAAIEDVHDAVCCNVLAPLYAYVAAWYLMAWVMCCCGLPAACLGRKRFPREPWGPVYEAVLSSHGGASAVGLPKYTSAPPPNALLGPSSSSSASSSSDLTAHPPPEPVEPPALQYENAMWPRNSNVAAAAGARPAAGKSVGIHARRTSAGATGSAATDAAVAAASVGGAVAAGGKARNARSGGGGAYNTMPVASAPPGAQSNEAHHVDNAQFGAATGVASRKNATFAPMAIVSAPMETPNPNKRTPYASAPPVAAAEIEMVNPRGGGGGNPFGGAHEAADPTVEAEAPPPSYEEAATVASPSAPGPSAEGTRSPADVQISVPPTGEGVSGTSGGDAPDPQPAAAPAASGQRGYYSSTLGGGIFGRGRGGGKNDPRTGGTGTL